MLERMDIIRLKCFRYAIISKQVSALAAAENSISASGQLTNRKRPQSQGGNESGETIFARPAVLSRLAHFLLTIQRENGEWSGKKAKPLVLAAEKTTTYIVVGVNPHVDAQV